MHSQVQNRPLRQRFPRCLCCHCSVLHQTLEVTGVCSALVRMSCEWDVHAWLLSPGLMHWRFTLAAVSFRSLFFITHHCYVVFSSWMRINVPQCISSTEGHSGLFQLSAVLSNSCSFTSQHELVFISLGRFWIMGMLYDFPIESYFVSSSAIRLSSLLKCLFTSSPVLHIFR